MHREVAFAVQQRELGDVGHSLCLAEAILSGEGAARVPQPALASVE
jgi:hypothetical protein